MSQSSIERADPFSDEEWDEILDYFHERLTPEELFEYFSEVRDRRPYKALGTFKKALYKHYDARQSWKIMALRQKLGIIVVPKSIEFKHDR